MFENLLSDLRPFLTLVLASVILILLDGLNFLSLPKSVTQKLTIPIQYGLYKNSLMVSKQFGFIFLSRHVFQENNALKQQLAQLISENANLKSQLTQTQSILEQQKTFTPQTFNMLPARPIGFSRFLYIDKGLEDGVKINQTVIFKDNYIGQVKEVSLKKSKVLPSSDPDSKIAAFSVNQDGHSRGVLLGQFGSEALLDKILHQEPVKKGDLVYSEGSDTDIPRGLILGQVIEVIGLDNQIFKQAKIKPVFNVTDLDLVFVITN